MAALLGTVWRYELFRHFNIIVNILVSDVSLRKIHYVLFDQFVWRECDTLQTYLILISAYYLPNFRETRRNEEGLCHVSAKAREGTRLMVICIFTLRLWYSQLNWIRKWKPLCDRLLPENWGMSRCESNCSKSTFVHKCTRYSCRIWYQNQSIQCGDMTCFQTLHYSTFTLSFLFCVQS